MSSEARSPASTARRCIGGGARDMGLYLRKSFRLGPLRVNLSRAGLGLSVGATGARFGMDATGHPYVHAGRGGLYYRRRWPTGATTAPVALLPPEDPPPAATHRRVAWGWVALLIVGLILGQVLLRVWR